MRAMTERRMVAVVRVTERCGGHCPFCGYDAGLFFRRRDIDERALLGFGRALADLSRRRRERILVSWSGGEPLAGLEALPGLFARRRDARRPDSCLDCHSPQVCAKYEWEAGR